MQARGQVLITAAELAGMIQAGDPVSILDVRWRLDEPDGHAAYLQGHLPGAVFVSLEDELSDHTIAGRAGTRCRRGLVCKPPSADAESDTMCRSWSTTTGIEPVPRERGGC
ncbi:thiosulfate sulfurtransferase SseB [Mycobacterium tuberculosis]|nr:thiosulfate sulfurtransferase SseB [Mycobacterium tuberculosis]